MSNNEVEFCGKCGREQETSSGEKCIQCAEFTVTWDKSRDTLSDVTRKWNMKHGKKY